MKTAKISILKDIIIIFTIVLLFFGCDLSLEMATDTFGTAAQGWWATGIDAITRNCRLITGGFYLFASIINQSIESFYICSYIFAIIFITLSIFVIEDKILKDVIENKFLRMLISVLIIINPFLIEYFMFLEKFTYAISIFCAVVAAMLFIKFLKDNKKKYLVCSGVSLLISAFSYQTITAIFIGITMPFIWYYNKDIKKYFKNLILLGTMYIGTLGINAIVAFAVGSSRIKRKAHVLGNMIWVIKEIPKVSIKMFGILPFGVFFGVLFILVLISIISIIKKNRKQYKNIFFEICNLIIIMCFILYSSTSSIILAVGWFAPRIIYPWGACIGILLINLLINILKERYIDIKNDKRILCICIILVLFISAQYISFQKILIDKQKNTSLDKYRIEIIGNAINKYEKENNVEISKIVFYRLDNEEQQYQDLFYSGDLIVSSFNTRWSDINAINYYLGTSYIKGTEKEEYVEKFSKIDNETVFSFEQMIFDGDTLHLLVY